MSFNFKDLIPSKQTLAVDIFVQYGTLFAKVALLKATASLNWVSLLPPPVFITNAIFFAFRISTICGDPWFTLFIFLHFIPCLFI